jgi:hypothetical protein
MRQEIRKRFQGRPRIWEAEIGVEDVQPYLLDGPRLIPIQTIQQRCISVRITKSEFAKHVVRDRQQLALARAARPSVIIDPNLVLYSPRDDAFYRFDRFTPKYAVFRFFRQNS